MRNRIKVILSIVLSLIVLLCTGCFNKESYFVENEYFNKAKYFIRYDSVVSNEQTCKITVTNTCNISLCKYTVKVRLYDEDNNLLLILEDTITKSFNENEELRNSWTINQKTRDATINYDIEYSGRTYEILENNEETNDEKENKEEENNEIYFNVTLNYNNGENNKIIKIKEGNVFEEPEEPAKNGYKFLGWYTDNNFVYRYDFSRKINENINLYAKFDSSKYFNVTLNYNNDRESETFLVKEGEVFERPENPIKEGWEFTGWYSDVDFINEYNFANAVNEDITLNAKFEEIIYYTVTINYNNGRQNEEINVKEGETFETPRDPYKSKYIFIGWYTNKYLYNKYDFSQKITRDIEIYAGYSLDSTYITNEISTKYIRGVVKIYNKSYNTFLGIETESITGTGSGFCFNISQNGYYYIMTNCHVAKKKSGYDKQELIIEDYLGNLYDGYLYQNPNKNYEAISSSYDLAVLYFVPKSTNVIKLDLGFSPNEGDDIISLGAPKGQSNHITYGSVLDYRKITLTNTATYLSNVKFDVIAHTSFTNNGSSGGPLLDVNLKVVGVNYAGSSNSTPNNAKSYAVPIAKVRNFLYDYYYN